MRASNPRPHVARLFLLAGSALSACTSRPSDGPVLSADSADDVAVEVPCDLSTITLPASYAQAADVTVIRDALNIPHIYAQNDADAFYAQGYLEARERLMQIDTTRRAADGTLSEVWGSSQLGSDEQARAIGFAKWACPAVLAIASERPADYALMVAFVSGENKYVSEVQADPTLRPYGMGENELNYTPQPFTPSDVLAMGRRITWGFSSSPEPEILYTLLEKLVPSYQDLPTFRPIDDTYTMQDQAFPASAQSTSDNAPATGVEAPDPATFAAFVDQVHSLRALHGNVMGSNNWVVNGAHTDNGMPFLANDPHAGLSDPSDLYMVQLDSKAAGGAFDVAGWGFAGVPGVQLGHNEKLVWGATVNFADVVDLWNVETTTDSDGALTKANIGGTETPIFARHESIPVKQDDGSVVDTDYVVNEIPDRGIFLGPEMLDIPNQLLGDGSILMNWTGFSGSDEFFEYFDLDRAATLDDFVAAVDYQQVGIHNTVGATADGIRYHVHGNVPDRGGVGRPEAYAVMDASDPATLWSGDWLPAEDFPDLDGSQDYIVTANNDPWGQTRDNDPNNDAFYYGAFYAPGFRASRIDHELARLMGEGPMSVTDMQALQTDIHSNVAEHLLPFLADAVAHIDDDDSLTQFRGDANLLEAATDLADWDQRANRDSQEMALFRAFQSMVAKRLLDDDLSILFDSVESVNPVTMDKFAILTLQDNNPQLTENASRFDLLSALQDAMTFVADRKVALNTDIFPWSDLHADSFGTSYGSGQGLAVDGENSSVNVSECSILNSGSLQDACNAGSGAVFRQVTSFDADGTPVTTFNWPFGNTTNADAWVAGTYDTLLFKRADVEATQLSSETLSP